MSLVLILKGVGQGLEVRFIRAAFLVMWMRLLSLIHTKQNKKINNNLLLFQGKLNRIWLQCEKLTDPRIHKQLCYLPR